MSENDKLGMYYTPKELLADETIQPNTGGYLKRVTDWLLSLFVNPPYGTKP